MVVTFGEKRNPYLHSTDRRTISRTRIFTTTRPPLTSNHAEIPRFEREVPE